MIVAFDKQLNTHWSKLAKIVRDLSAKRAASPALTSFVEFALQINTPLSALIAPLVYQKVNAPFEVV